MRILLTNDDGVFAPGLRAMHRELRAIGDVLIVAPASEQSAVGHSITLLNPLVVQEVHDESGKAIGYAVEGKPADCVKLGLVELSSELPGLVVSGINAGANAGINVLYSGTVAAAIEGAFCSITSIAVSLEAPNTELYERAARHAARVIRQLLARAPEPGALFNVNIPDLARGEPKGVLVTQQALSAYRERYEARVDPRNRRYFWLMADALPAGEHPETDLAALAAGYISVTPLHFDLTARRRYDEMRSWSWEI